MQRIELEPSSDFVSGTWYDGDRARTWEERETEGRKPDAQAKESLILTQKGTWILKTEPRNERNGAITHRKITPEHVHSWLIANGHFRSLVGINGLHLKDMEI